jgi:putative toxin-antitoxin system antitoxin component (TIGR02293 family)
MAKHPRSSVSRCTGRRHASLSKIYQFVRENDIDALIACIEAGIAARVITHLPSALAATRTQVADLLGISDKRFQRLGKASLHDALNRHVGERLIRILQVRQKAVDTLEDEDRALAWLQEANPAFAQRTPILHARTELGCRQIENELNRIEHGVFS